MHQRQIIRDAFVAQLVGKTAAGARVKSTRTEPYRVTELPAISVYTPSEEVDADSKRARPRELVRNLEVAIDAFVAHTEATPAVNALDDIAADIEAAIDADPYLGGACGLEGAILSSTDVSVLDDETRRDPLIGIVKLTYTVPYATVPAAPTLDDFRRVDAKTQIVGAASNNIAEDIITVQEDPP